MGTNHSLISCPCTSETEETLRVADHVVPTSSLRSLGNRGKVGIPYLPAYALSFHDKTRKPMEGPSIVERPSKPNGFMFSLEETNRLSLHDFFSSSSALGEHDSTAMSASVS